MGAARFDMKKPAVGVFEQIDSLVRHLPEQMIEVAFAARSGDLLVYRVTTDRASATSAFTVNACASGFRCRYKIYNGDFALSNFAGHRLLSTPLVFRQEF